MEHVAYFARVQYGERYCWWMNNGTMVVEGAA